MTTWTSDELNKIGNAEELEIAALRADGTLASLQQRWLTDAGRAPVLR